MMHISLFAGPPMKSSDPFVPSVGEFEINIAVEGEHKEDKLFRAPIIDFNYGIMQDVQVTLESAYVISRYDDEYVDDFDSFEVALKWCFLQGDVFSIALSPKYKSYPVNSIFNSGETYELDIPMNFVVNEKIDLVVDSAYIMPKDCADHFEFGTYLKFKDDKHTYYTELFVENVANKDEDIFVFGALGYMYQFHKNIAFMISYGKEIGSKDLSTVGYSGLQFVY